MPAGYGTPATPLAGKSPPMSGEEAQARRDQLIEMNMREVVTAVNGSYTAGSSAFSQLVAWGVSMLGSLGSIAQSFVGWIFDLPIISDIVEVLTGKEDGDLNDLGTFGLNIRHGIQRTIDSIVGALFGWIGDLFSGDDAEQALQDAANTIAGLSAAVTALQSNQNNAAVGGTSAVVDLTTAAAGVTLGPNFAHIRSGGSGRYHAVPGRGAVWQNYNDGDSWDSFVYTGQATTTDYQKVWLASASAPRWNSSANAGRVEIHGRKNLAGDTYVFAELEKNRSRIGCVVGGARTYFTVNTGFSYKATATYSLECGTVGALRVFRILEGSRVIHSHTEVGATSQAGPDFRYTGGAGFSRYTWAGPLTPANFLAFAMGDNQPPTVRGSGSLVYRASGTYVGINTGENLLPNSFFDSPGESTADMSFADGAFTVTNEGWYHIETRLKSATASFPNHFELIAVKTTSSHTEKRYMDQDHAYINENGPYAVYGSCPMYLQNGDSVRIGYKASSSFGNFHGEASGQQSWFSVIATGIPHRSQPIVDE